jgi:hypothetical protein
LWQDAQTRAILAGLLEKNSGNVRISPPPPFLSHSHFFLLLLIRIDGGLIAAPEDAVGGGKA